MTTTVDPALTDMLTAVFAEHRDSAGQLGDHTFWEQLDRLGLVRLTGAEDAGGSGAGWAESAELLNIAARQGVKVPLAEHDLLACWLLETLGMDTDKSRRTLCLLDETGEAQSVPWASWADRVVVVSPGLGGWTVADVDADQLDITPGWNAAGEPRDRVRAAAHDGVPAPAALIRGVQLRGALARSAQLCGALDRILELTVAFAGERSQFGRTLARFQAIQHMVADMAAEAALAHTATDAALAAMNWNLWESPELKFRIAVARSCAGHASSVVVRHAHQIHGAIGTTREHQLHEFTTAVLSWRSEFGSVRYWDELLTEAALAAGHDGLWPLVSS